ncbi:MAG: MmcQ/YjbR family DNA-binding protein [Proteobacteria bacterium]|nr:MmcQ/YjbR family DNA-binding protein [Pseudomonadota bacterium]
MATPADVKKIAMALEGVSEIDHFGRPGYRTKKRIFAVMRPDGLYLNLDEERKDFLFEADPRTFVKYMWGKTANVIVQIGRIGKPELARLIGEAWERNKGVTVRTGRSAPSTRRRKPIPTRNREK